MSEQPASLAAALVQLQGGLPRIVKDATGQVQNRTYRYATLAAIHDEIFPLLLALGLLWVCKPTLREDGQFVLAYSLLHTPSGEAETGEYPLGTGTPQAIGSAITYGRRYCIMTVLGLVPAEDDDGAQGTEWQPPANPRTRKADRHNAGRSGALPDDDWTDAAPSDVPGSITDGRKTEVRYWFDQRMIPGQDRLAYAIAAVSREITSSDDLSEVEGIKLVKTLKEEAR